MDRQLAASFAMALACSTVSNACFARPDGEASLMVRYDDLDLSTPAGLKVLHRRIEQAADQVCVDAAGLEASQQTDLACRADAMASAQALVRQATADQLLSKSRALAETKPR